ncbi:MAG: hypothetical protein L3J47_01620 [Sulfurovum sp.]|nr:hypothetical protein [Sulfurovum sp.]
MRLLMGIIFLSIALHAHNLFHTISYEKAVTVTLSFAEDEKFSYQSYEVYPPDQKIPFQVGRTDALGRVIFLPNKSGTWKVNLFSEDGHGKIVNIEVKEQSNATKTDTIKQTNNSLLVRALVGMGMLFAIFGLLYLIQQRKDHR